MMAANVYGQFEVMLVEPFGGLPFIVPSLDV